LSHLSSSLVRLSRTVRIFLTNSEVKPHRIDDVKTICDRATFDTAFDALPALSQSVASG
jgi:hypothetical protein